MGAPTGYWLDMSRARGHLWLMGVAEVLNGRRIGLQRTCCRSRARPMDRTSPFSTSSPLLNPRLPTCARLAWVPIERHPARFDHERTSDLPAAKRIHAMDGAAAADWRAHLFLLRRLSHSAQPQLLVDVRRHPRLHARRTDRHG